MLELSSTGNIKGKAGLYPQLLMILSCPARWSDHRMDIRSLKGLLWSSLSANLTSGAGQVGCVNSGKTKNVDRIIQGEKRAWSHAQGKGNEIGLKFPDQLFPWSQISGSVPCFFAKWSEVKLLSRVRCPTFATPWTVAYQAPPSMGFSRQEYWSGLPFPSPGDLPDPGIEPRSPAL